MLIVSKFSQSPNAPCPIVDTLFESFTLVKLEHPKNAKLPIVVAPIGSVTLIISVLS